MAKGKKSPNGSGSIWQRPDGRYGAALTYPYHDAATGRTKRRRTSTTKPNWDEAHKWLMERQNDLLGGVAVSPENPTFGEFLKGWLRDVVEPSVAPKTHEKREYHVGVHIAPALGHVRLKELAARQIQAFYTRLARREPPLATSTRRDIHTTLKMSLNQALRWGLIPRNPCDLVDPPRPILSDDLEDEEEEEIRALTDEQARKLFAATESKRWHHYYIAAIRTGLRPGELLGLKWRDLVLDADPGSLRVRRTLGVKPDGETYMKPPKSEASKRTLALHWEATEAFAAQREMLVGEGLATGPKDLVFPNTIGTPMSHHNLRRRYLQSDLERAKLPRLTLHELRHTFASIMLYEWRVPLEIVAEMMGHESPAMTLRLYAHFVPGSQEEAIRALRRMHQKPIRTARTET